MKTFFDKKQAVTVLIQVEAGSSDGVNFFKEVSEDHKYFKLSCDDLASKLSRYIDDDNFAGVVENVT